LEVEENMNYKFFVYCPDDPKIIDHIMGLSENDVRHREPNEVRRGDPVKSNTYSGLLHC